ncbi:MAG: sarcosine oxidase subunit gamma family protein [Steroidobacteraceae bacterium]
MADTAMRRVPAVPSSGWLKALPSAVRLVLHGDARARALALPHWGAEFSEAACRATVNGTRATLWLGPDEYLLLDSAPGASAASAIEELERALADAPHALVDISHRQFALEISGPHASAILNGACPLDLDPGEFPIGMCTRTVFAKADIVLWRTRSDAFHLEVWRSFAGYVAGVLAELATEFYGSR